MAREFVQVPPRPQPGTATSEELARYFAQVRGAAADGRVDPANARRVFAATPPDELQKLARRLLKDMVRGAPPPGRGGGGRSGGGGGNGGGSGSGPGSGSGAGGSSVADPHKRGDDPC